MTVLGPIVRLAPRLSTQPKPRGSVTRHVGVVRAENASGEPRPGIYRSVEVSYMLPSAESTGKPKAAKVRPI